MIHPTFKPADKLAVLVIKASLLFVLLLNALLLAPIAAAEEIAGLWKPARGDAILEISFSKTAEGAAGTGIVVRNGTHPERVGRVFLKDLQTNNSRNKLWLGLIWVEKMDEYKGVEVSLPEADRMVTTGRVGFLSRSMEWQRVDTLSDPAPSAE